MLKHQINGRKVTVDVEVFANNIGFAIPINIVKQVSSEILVNKKVTRSWIGLHCQPLQELEDYFGTNLNSGVLISSIDSDSPAERSFLKAGDIVLELDGNPVKAITKQMQLENQLIDTSGVFVVGVKNVGAGKGGGLRRRDVIKKINKTTILSLEDFISLYNDLTIQNTEKISLTINRGGATRWVLLDISDTERDDPHE